MNELVSAADAPTSVVDGPVPARFIEAVLEGGPADLPTDLRAHRIRPRECKIKVPHYGGYEHFERDPADGYAVPTVFRWTGRTRIAE
jgi:hypothetical protein